jgi:hypothetical protein
VCVGEALPAGFERLERVLYTPRNKLTPAALAMVMSAEGASEDHRSAG